MNLRWVPLIRPVMFRVHFRDKNRKTERKRTGWVTFKTYGFNRQKTKRWQNDNPQNMKQTTAESRQDPPIQNKNYKMKKILSALSLSILTVSAFAQSGTNSPYSQYGLGVLTDQGNGINRGMNGVGLGLREGNQINYLNPASYSSVDSLTFIFDVGMSLQVTNFKEGNVKKNANNADFEYAVGGFRIMPRMGLAFGILPYTNSGYSYQSSGVIDRDDTQSQTSYSNVYSGSGGLHQVFLGLGWEPVRNFSIGVNGGYLWGNSTRSVATSYSDNYANTLSKTYSYNVSSYKLDFGLQYSQKISKKDRITLGATYGLGHNLNADPALDIVSVNSQTGVTDTTSFVSRNGIELPNEFAVGLAYSHNGQLTLAFDYQMQQWSKVKYPKYSTGSNGSPSYHTATNMFDDRQKFNLGAEYCRNKTGRSFSSRIRYRLGASYTTPYLKINGLEGPKELSVSGGLGIPIINGWNNRSILNISAQWVRSSAKDMITENTFRINVGLTFNERWFAKWKFD